MAGGLVSPSRSSPRLLALLRRAIRVRHYSRRTEDSYVSWVRRFVRFCGMRHPLELAEREVERFLTSLAVEGGVSASTQNQALAALVAALLYGSGLRLLEGLQLRVKDLDFARREIVVRGGKGDRDRRTMLPEVLISPLLRHLAGVRDAHDRDVARGGGRAELPEGIDRKFPSASAEWVWQWVFPARREHVGASGRERRRHHLHETVVQRAFRAALQRAGISKRATCHSLRHSFATPKTKLSKHS